MSMQELAVFFFNDTATTEIYTPFPTRRSSDLQRGDGAQQVAQAHAEPDQRHPADARVAERRDHPAPLPPLCRADRKSTRLNSTHAKTAYAVFCLKKTSRLRSAFFDVCAAVNPG